jgi:hypothetical protein
MEERKESGLLLLLYREAPEGILSIKTAICLFIKRIKDD